MVVQLALAAVTLTASLQLVERNAGDDAEPTVLALELGRLGDDTGPGPSALERRGTSQRTFGPVHPSAPVGRYTGRNLGAYQGKGTGSYTGGGLGRIETFGMDQPRDREDR